MALPRQFAGYPSTWWSSRSPWMHERQRKMEEEMREHMMQHLQMGKASMSQCPMMKGR